MACRLAGSGIEMYPFQPPDLTGQPLNFVVQVKILPHIDGDLGLLGLRGPREQAIPAFTS
jgi:hypothetical protein